MKKRHWQNLFLITLIGLVVYANSLNNSFHFDDFRLFDKIRPVKTLKELLDTSSIFRWLSTLSVFSVYRLFGEKPFPHHLLSVVFHILVGWSVYWSAVLLFKNEVTQSKTRIPLLVSILFLVHPLCTEGVNYLSARSTQMGTLFAFSFLAFLILYWKGKKLLYLIGLVASLLLAGLSKEISIYYCVSILFLFLAVFYPSIWESKQLRRKSGVIIAAVSVLFLLFASFFTELPGRLTFYGLGRVGEYFLVENKVFLDYLKLLIFPFYGLNVDHHHTWSLDFLVPVSIILNAGLLFLGFFLWKKKRIIAFAIFWVYVLLLPYFFIASEELMVEYRVYPAIFGFVVLLAYLLEKILARTKYRRLITVVFVVALSAATFLRNFDWRDPVSLWKDAVSKSPRKARVHSNLGTAFASAGKDELAVDEFKKAIALEPTASEPHNNLALVYMRMGHFDAAIAGYEEALRLKVNDLNKEARIHMNLGILYALKKENEKAKKSFDEALKVGPNIAEIHYNLGLFFHGTNDYDSAIESFKKTISLSPVSAEVHNALGIVYDLKGFHDLAIEEYRKALERDPKFSVAYFNLGIAYEHKNLIREAISYYEKALRLDPNYAKVYNNLGAINYRRKEYEKAIENFQKAISLDSNLLEGYNNLATIYQERKMYREAAELYRKVLDADSENKEAKKNYEEILSKLGSRKAK